MANLLAYHIEGITEAGCDEAGRGCLAGPVYAAAVILPPDFNHPMLNDSKQLSHKNRMILRDYIFTNAKDYAIAFADNNEIDKINILNASFLAMHRALSMLKITPDHILVDGNRFKKYQTIPHSCMVKGDGKYASIAAASILAKTERDIFMEKIDLEYPQYDWKQNKGYPTEAHRNRIATDGLTPYHRKSFTLNLFQMKLF